MSRLRLVVYDATDVPAEGSSLLRIPRVERRADGTAHGTGGLTPWWRRGATLHRLLRHADGTFAAVSWGEALRWAAGFAAERGARIAELQAWGHGGFGFMRMGSGPNLDRDALAHGGALAGELTALRERLDGDALLWLRCCSAFGSTAGRGFAPALAERLGARVAGHTFIIGGFQSGTHSLGPGETPSWAVDEGVEQRADGTACARLSSAFAPRTISCLRLSMPRGW